MECKEDGCSLAPHGLGLCSKHYTRLRRYGDVQHLGRAAPGSTDWEKLKFRGWLVSRSGCWEYSGPRVDVKGKLNYGLVNSLYAHRVSYEHHYGPIPEGLIVRHKCDNPPCINPEHLELGTHGDNARDRDERGRRKAPRGESNGFSKLDEAQVLEIRKLCTEGLLTFSAIGAMFGVTGDAIGKIANRKNWAWL